MNNTTRIFLGIVFFVILLVVTGAFYFVDETRQVVITQFGEPIGHPITKAGLRFKLPVVQKANYFEKRLLEWDGDPNQIPTRDKRYIWVDTAARWKITDALKFMQSVGTETGAQARLDDIIDAATRDEVSNLVLVEAVRNSNRLINSKEIIPGDTLMGQSALEKISVGRAKLTQNILKRSNEVVPTYGIEIVDVRVKRISYVEDVRKKVYERMISERKRAAEQYRSEGQGKRAEIEGQMAKELKQIKSEAYKKAQKIKGKADAEAIRIYAEAYNKDPEFYSFTKTLETYRDTVNKDTTLLLTTDGDFYKYMKSIGGADSLQ